MEKIVLSIVEGETSGSIVGTEATFTDFEMNKDESKCFFMFAGYWCCKFIYNRRAVHISDKKILLLEVDK